MTARPRYAGDRARLVVIAACAASTGAHVALTPEHLEHEPAMGVAFIVASLLTFTLATALTLRLRSTMLAGTAAVVFAGLIAAYVLNVATGIPGLSDGPEPVDLAGAGTKAVEAIGLIFALHLMTTLSGRRSLVTKEARS